MKKKIFAVFFALLVLCTAVVPVFADEADDWDFSEEYPTAEPTGVTINVYNWGEYISNGTEGSLDVNAEFTRRTGIEVNYTTFDSNESLYSKLAGGGDADKRTLLDQRSGESLEGETQGAGQNTFPV